MASPSTLMHTAAACCVGLAVVHSGLGERFLVSALLRPNHIPVRKLRRFSASGFVQWLIRVAWHITSAGWMAYAWLLYRLASQDRTHLGDTEVIHTLLQTIKGAFGLHAILCLSKKHFAWVCFLIAALGAWRAQLPTSGSAPLSTLSPSSGMLLSASSLGVCVLAHSVLGELWLLRPLLRHAKFPRLGGPDSFFSRRTYWFAWHITSLVWAGLAVMLYQLRHSVGDAPSAHSSATGASHALDVVLRTTAMTFAAQFLLCVVAVNGRHLAWILFLAAALCCHWARAQ